MKLFTNKKVWSKIIVILIFLLLFQFVSVRPVHATNDTIEFAGKLMSPIMSLVITLSDGVMGLIHSSIMGQDEALLEIDLDSSVWEILGWVVIGILVVAACVAFCVLCPGGIAVIIGGVAKILVAGVIGAAIWSGVSDGLDKVKAASYAKENLPDTLYLPTYTISPEEIFTGKILLFDVDFFNNSQIEIKEHKSPRKSKEKDKYLNENNEEVSDAKDAAMDVDYYYYIDDDGKEVKTSKQNMAQDLRGIISKWYVSLRNIALVGMMIVLIYIGIRMILSTIASDKAKYKQMLQDWFMALLLLFLMHYIMAFSVEIVKKVTDIISTSVGKDGFISVIPDDEHNKMSKFIEDAGMSDYLQESNGVKYLYYPTDMLGFVRIRAELANWGTEYIGYGICFVILVMFTLFFVFTYIKRVIYMAFLTIIAPLVAFTYPIDKIKDGSAQGFDKWFKEYIFNLLIQPLHLILYYILITSAFSLASTNIIYSLIALGFMMPAEKLLRGFFGFEKAHTPGLLAGPAGAALTMSAMNSLANKGKKALGGGNESNKGNSNNANSSSSDETRKPRMNESVNEASVYGDSEDNTNSINQKQAGDDINNNNSEQPLLDAYDEKFGTDEWDASERDAMARELNSGEENKLSAEEYEDELRRAGLSEDEIREEMKSFNKQEKDKQDNNSSIKQDKLTPYQKPKRKLKAKAKRFARAEGKKLAIKGLNTAKRLPRNSIRFAGNIAGGAIGGTIGLAAGIVSGDPNKAFQYTTAGSAAVKSIVSKYANNIPTIGKIDNADTKYQEVMNNRRYEDLQRDDYFKEKRKEVKKALKKNFDKEEVDKRMNDGTADRYIEEGISANDMVAAELMRKEDPTLGIDKTILTVKNANAIGNNYKGPDAKEWENHLASNIQEKAGRNVDFAKKEAKATMGRIAKYNKVKKSIYK